jgi:peptidyl-prolyl cis-trans isomerase C
MSPSDVLDAPPGRIGAADPSPDGFRYHLLRAASERFQRSIPALDEAQLRQALQQARRSFDLEERVLRSDEAQQVVIPDAQLERALTEVEQRYTSRAELEDDLARNGLDPDQLRRALRRELIFDAVMQRVGARHAPVTETDERIFFELHRDRFGRPECRSARHILITINDDYPDNSRETARARIEAVAARLHDASGDLLQRFADAAARTSECPTALDGGQLGRVSRGQLYPPVDAALFALQPGTLSGVVETELGFHLILCEEVHPDRSVPFTEVRERIHQALEQRRRKQQQRQWLDALTS